MTGISFAHVLIHFSPPLRQFIFSKPYKVYETEKNLCIAILLYTVRIGLALLFAAAMFGLGVCIKASKREHRQIFSKQGDLETKLPSKLQSNCLFYRL